MGERIGRPITETTSIPRVPYRVLPVEEPFRQPERKPAEPAKTPEKEPVPVSEIRSKRERLRSLSRTRRIRYNRS